MKKINKIIRSEENEFGNDLLVSLALVIHCYIEMIGSAIIGMLIVDLIFFIQFFKNKIKIYEKCIFIIIFAIIAFSISLFKRPQEETVRYYILYFLLYNIPLLGIGMVKFNMKNVVKYSIIIAFAFVPFFLLKNPDTYNKMGMGYSMLPAFLISIVGLFILIPKRIKILALCNISVIGVFYVDEGMRGIIFAIGIFFILWFHVFFVSIFSVRIRKIITTFSLGCILCGIGVFLFNLVSIVLTLNEVLKEKFNIELYAFQKFLFYLKRNNVSNGRSSIATDVINLIKESPFIGHGIGYIESIVGVHSHNIFLQATCEFGIFGFFIVFCIFIYSFKYILFTLPNKYRIDENSKEKSLFFIVIFITGLFFLIYSSTYWIYGQFWFFLGILLRKDLINEKLEKGDLI